MSFAFEDPVTLEVMKNAVVTLCGHSFSQETIEEWLETKQSCPLCNARLTHDDVKPNYALRDAITHYLEQQQGQQINNNNGEVNASNSSTTIPLSPPQIQTQTQSPISIKEIHPSRINDAGDVLENAFRNDPLVRYFYSVYDKDAISGMKWFSTCIVDYGVRKGRVWAAYNKNIAHDGASESELVGVAIWQPPFESGVSFLEMMKSGMIAAPLRMGFRRSLKAVATLDVMESKHKEAISGPHWSLYSVGVLPSFQSQGIGTRLLTPILNQADEDNLPCYLDTASQRSLRFFEQLGFEVVSSTDNKKVPPFWCLVRRPRAKPSN